MFDFDKGAFMDYLNENYEIDDPTRAIIRNIIDYATENLSDYKGDISHFIFYMLGPVLDINLDEILEYEFDIKEQ